jgi:poly(A) polymerase/tRNA nucleotidyltransferase (CCA-adding enzyme)
LEKRTQKLLSDQALTAVLSALPRARLVGGCVRDLLAGVDIADIDLATPDPPDKIIAALETAGLRAIPTGLAHGTVTALSDGRPFEITTLRRDIATDGRHAIVAFTEDWQADAARRDFTCNALSMARDGAIFDYFTGIADLRAGLIRFVGDPATRIAEDSLRILRFFRFHARFGIGDPDPAARHAIAASLHGLATLSGERIWSELRRLLSLPDPAPTLALMHTTGVLHALLPTADLARRLPANAPADPLLRLAALLATPASAIDAADRWHLATADRDHLLALLDAPAPPPDTTDNTLRQLLADTPRKTLVGRIWLAGGDPHLLTRLAALETPIFPLQGRDLAALGVAPGPAMGTLLRDLRAWWLATFCVADHAACLDELRRRLA